MHFRLVSHRLLVLSWHHRGHRFRGSRPRGHQSRLVRRQVAGTRTAATTTPAATTATAAAVIPFASGIVGLVVLRHARRQIAPIAAGATVVTRQRCAVVVAAITRTAAILEPARAGAGLQFIRRRALGRTIATWRARRTRILAPRTRLARRTRIGAFATRLAWLTGLARRALIGALRAGNADLALRTRRYRRAATTTAAATIGTIPGARRLGTHGLAATATPALATATRRLAAAFAAAATSLATTAAALATATAALSATASAFATTAATVAAAAGGLATAIVDVTRCAARARHHAHTKRACAKAEEPSAAFFHHGDGHFRAVETQRVQPLAYGIFERLAFEGGVLGLHREPRVGAPPRACVCAYCPARGTGPGALEPAPRARARAANEASGTGLAYVEMAFLATVGETSGLSPSRSTSHCWRAVNRFITVQYSTSPEGRL